MTFDNQESNPQDTTETQGDASNPSESVGNNEGQPSYDELKTRMDELVKGTNKVMEENAKYRKAFDAMSDTPAVDTLSQEELEARQMISERLGFADKNSVQEIIEARMKAAEDKAELDSIIREFPELSAHRGYIEKIGSVEQNKTWDEIIAETNLVEREKLEAARKMPIRGSISQKEPTVARPTAMSDDEYDNWLNSNTEDKRYK